MKKILASFVGMAITIVASGFLAKILIGWYYTEHTIIICFPLFLFFIAGLLGAGLWAYGNGVFDNIDG